jgi:hypothetical protein
MQVAVGGRKAKQKDEWGDESREFEYVEILPGEETFLSIGTKTDRPGKNVLEITASFCSNREDNCSPPVAYLRFSPPRAKTFPAQNKKTDAAL